MSRVEKYVEEFKEFKNADRRWHKKYHADVAPHQPILLLALIKLYRENRIDLKKINPKSEDLTSTTKKIWKDWLEYERDFRINQPLCAMRNSQYFWKRSLKEDFEREEDGEPSYKEYIYYIEDDVLINILADEKFQKKLIRALLWSGKTLSDGTEYRCFSPDDRDAIKEKMGL